MNDRNSELRQGPTELPKDFLLRIKEAAKGDTEFAMTSTPQFLAALSERVSTWLSPLQEDCEILVSAVRQRHRLLEYKDLYISYLGGLINEHEFETHATAFSAGNRGKVEPSRLARRVSDSLI